MPLKLYRRKRSPNWYLRGTVRGIPVEETAGTADRGAAEEIRARREAELLDRSIHGVQAVAAFGQAALSYMEHGGERRYLAPLVARFEHTLLPRIDQAALDAAARELKPEASAATRNRQVYTPMAAVLHHAAKRGLCEFRPIERPRQPKGRDRWLSPAEAERLIEAAADHLRPLLIFLFGTGARLSEALYLDWSAVNLQDRRTWFLDTKNGESRGVPLNERVWLELAKLPHREGAVFRWPNRRRQRGRVVWEPYAERLGGGGQINTAFAAACRRAGFADRVARLDAEGRQRRDAKGRPLWRWKPRYSPHSCRHSWASWFYAETRDLRALMELGGWKSERMVMRYTHLNPDHLSAAVERLPWAAQSGK